MYNRLYAELKKHGITQVEIARVIGVSKPTVSQKMNGHSEFTSSEMYAICNLIPDVPMHELFVRG